MLLVPHLYLAYIHLLLVMVNPFRLRPRPSRQRSYQLNEKPPIERHFVSVLGSALSIILLVLALSLKSWALPHRVWPHQRHCHHQCHLHLQLWQYVWEAGGRRVAGGWEVGERRGVCRWICCRKGVGRTAVRLIQYTCVCTMRAYRMYVLC